MFKIFSLLVAFLKELVFESKEEQDFRSEKFNVRKMMVVIIITMSLFLNIFLMTKVYHLALANHSYRKTVKSLTESVQLLQEKTRQLIPSDSQKQVTEEPPKKKPNRRGLN